MPIEIPIYLALIPFAVFAFIFVIFTFFNIYHMLKNGLFGFNLYLIVVVYLAGTVLLLWLSWSVISSFDWSAKISLESILGNSADLFPQIKI